MDVPVTRDLLLSILYNNTDALPLRLFSIP